MLSATTLHRVLRVATVLALMAIAYVGGVVTGAVGSGKPAPRGGVIDEAADRIASNAVRPVDRKALERHGITDSNASILRPRDPARSDSAALLEEIDLAALSGPLVPSDVSGTSGRS